MAEPVGAPIFKRDSRGADFQTQIEDLNAALQEWRRTRQYSPYTEERLAQITVQCARMVEAWQQSEQRRNGSGAPDTTERLRALERTIEHEWEALREIQEQPASHSSSPPPLPRAENRYPDTELAVRSPASIETRLTALEQDLQDRMAQISRDLQAVLIELRSSRPQSASAPAFPLESVMRIHEELRGSEGGPQHGPQSLKGGAVRALPESTEATAALATRLESLERAVASSAVSTAQPVPTGRPRLVVPLLLASLAGMIVFAVWMQRRVDSRLDEAATRIAAAEQQRDASVAATREEASRQVAEAQQSAAQATMVGDVLAAPDRIRFWMSGVGASSRAYAQLLFSRSRGIVFSASRLPQAAPGQTYQLWLLTIAGPISVAPLTPDSAGRVTLAMEIPRTLQSRLMGPLVTLEPDGGSTQPSGQKVLIRITE